MAFESPLTVIQIPFSPETVRLGISCWCSRLEASGVTSFVFEVSVVKSTLSHEVGIINKAFLYPSGHEGFSMVV